MQGRPHTSLRLTLGLAGHASRGTLLSNFCWRFNWFGDMWPGAVGVERGHALRATVVRALAAAGMVTAAVKLAGTAGPTALRRRA